MEALKFGILGPLEVRQAKRRLELGGRRQQAVLAVLLIEANRVVSIDRLIDDVWGEFPPKAAKATVQSYVSRLRRSLEPEAATPAVLCTHGTGYTLEVDPDDVDAIRFERLADEGRAALRGGDAEVAAGLFSDALALWRGPALVDFAYEPFAAGEAARLEELRLAVIEDRVDAALALGRHSALIPELEQLVGAQPLRERLREQLMLALYRSGRQAEALRTYQAARRVLGDELGIDPSPALKALEAAILVQDASLDRVPSESAPLTRPAAGGPVVLSETVTFLMAGVEGSSRLWVDQPDLAAPALARHDEIVGDVCAGRGATLSATSEGDTVVAVFRQASAATGAAVEILRAVLEEPWPAGTRLRSTIALHTGEAVLRDGRYHGVAVNRATTLRSLAHGGQILMSQPTADVVGEHLSDGSVLEYLGTCRLSELNRAEPVWQLYHPELPSVFPPLPSPEFPPHNMPAVLSSLVGREREAADVRKILDTARLVTLTGPAGIGKTRLALQVAAELLTDYADGVWFVDLAPVSDPALIAQSVATALGVSEEPGRPLLSTLAGYLRPLNLLMVIDNCEHMVEDCAALVERVLRAAPGVGALATSRERLRVAGEVVWAVPSLRVPEPSAVASLADLEPYEGAELFLTRAGDAQPHLAFHDRDAAPVAQICSRLDGIPLAIELAAARVGVLTPAEIVARLENRFRLLTSSAHGEVSRHATLRTALDWSYDLLDDAQQVLLRRLAVFPGTFTLAAAEAVGSGPLIKEEEVLDLLDSLLARSLVQRKSTPAETRFRLLETIRCYAAERLVEAGDGPDAARRHLEFFLALAERLEPSAFGSDAGAALDQLESEHDNFRAALRHVLGDADGHLRPVGLRLAHALFPLWEIRNHRVEGQTLMEALLVQPGRPDAMASAVARRAGNLARSDSDEEAAERLWTQALDLARQAGDRRHLGRALSSVARAAHSRGDLDGARGLLEESHALAEEVGDEVFVAESLLRLAWIDYDQGRYDEAQARAERARVRNGDDWLTLTQSYDILGRVARDRGDYPEARRCFEQACEISRTVHDEVSLAEALDGLGLVAVAEGRTGDARLAWEEALVLLRTGPRVVVVGPLGGLATLASAEGDHATARSFLDEEFAAACRINDRLDIAETVLRMGRAAAAHGDDDEAVRRYVEVLSSAREAGMPWYVAASLDGLAAILPVSEHTVAMCAAAERVRKATGAVLSPADRRDRDRWITAARGHLGGDVVDRAWAAGDRADLEATVALATTATAAGER